MARDGSVRRAAVAVLVALLVLGAASVAVLDLTGRLPGGLVADDPARRSASGPGSSTPPLPAALDPVRSPAGPVLAAEPTGSPDPAAVFPGPALGAVLDSASLGGASAVVVDVASGEVLLERASALPRTPASVAKLVTGLAVLSAYPPGQRLTTRVVAGATPDDVVLVGAGDASLTRRPVGRGGLPVRASLTDLADQVAVALRDRVDPASPVTVRVDDSLFPGPAVNPAWPASYLASGVVAPVHALSVDQGRRRAGSDDRVADPALAAGQDLARLLARRGVAVAAGVERSALPAAAGAAVLGEVASPTIGELVDLCLQTSDNDLAEALLRLAGLGAGLPATVEGGTATAVRSLTALGIPTEGVSLRDGSGLSRDSTLPSAALATLLVAAADGGHPELAPLLDGLPVAGFSGTLADRFAEGPSEAAAGLVRAKTGTLTGVSALAGVTTAAGRPVAFVVLADQVPADATLQARAELDRFTAVLAGVG